MSGIELGDVRLLEPPERIDIGVPDAERAIGGDQLQNAELLLANRERPRRALAQGRRGRCFREVDEALLHFLVGNVRGTVVQPLQLVEIAPPARLDRLRVLQIRLVQRLDERRVRAEQIGVTEEFFHHGLDAQCLSLSVKCVNANDPH